MKKGIAGIVAKARLRLMKGRRGSNVWIFAPDNPYGIQNICTVREFDDVLDAVTARPVLATARKKRPGTGIEVIGHAIRKRKKKAGKK